jgi:hypothetical protein
MNERHCICGQRAESLVMLVNEFVLSTDLAVQNHRANYSVRKLTAATIITLIFQPAIYFTASVHAGIARPSSEHVSSTRLILVLPKDSKRRLPETANDVAVNPCRGLDEQA